VITDARHVTGLSAAPPLGLLQVCPFIRPEYVQSAEITSSQLPGTDPLDAHLDSSGSPTIRDLAGYSS
jgi:hypothetical protein